MRSTTIAGLGLAGATLLAACGGSASGDTPAAPSAANITTAATAVEVGHTGLGDVLVNASGHTLYGFTNDSNGTSTCAGTCAQSWPPVTVGTDWKPGAAAEQANVHTIPRGDGQLQLAAGKWPLYTFAGDRAAGDVNGQGQLGKWFVVQPDGSLLKLQSPASSGSSTSPAPSGYGY